MKSYGITSLPVIPIRASPNNKSEQTNQLLFGETFVITKQNNTWIYIVNDYDQYGGWVERKQITPIDHVTWNTILKLPKKITSTHLCPVYLNEHPTHIPMGSVLHGFDGFQFDFLGKKISFQKKYSIDIKAITGDIIKHTALKYINTPYLWGGKSPLGIDCSGYTQMVFKLLGIYLPRDAYQQAKVGISIPTIRQSQIGDLVFFSENTKITHVGIMLSTNTLIHASGKVRIDQINHKGIYVGKRYSHQLNHIKRII